VLTTTNYNGLNFGQTATIQGGTAAIPPDPQGAVGPFSYIETVNLSVAIFDPNTSSVNPTTDSVDDFFGVVGSLPDPNPSDLGNTFTDPVVSFDNQTQRFLVAGMEIDPGPQIEPGATGNNSSVFDVAVSKTSNPTTLTTFDWSFYQVRTTETNEFSDFPGNLGFNGGALVVTLNEFNVNTLNVNHVLVSAVSMSDLTNGVSLTNLHIYQSDFQGANLRPTSMHDSTSVNDPMWLVQEHPGTGGLGDGQHIDVVKMTNVLSSNPTFTTTTLSVNHYTDVSRTPPLQPDGSVVTPEIDSRIEKVAEQNNDLVATHSVSVSSTEDDAQWYLIDVSSGTPVLKQQGRVSGGNRTYITYPAIDINPAGDIGMTYMQSGTARPTDFLSTHVTGRKISDPAGTMEAPVVAQAGQQLYQDFGPASGSSQRAGDLSGINVDSAGNFWAVDEFADNEPLPTLTSPSADWGTNIASFTLNPLADLSVAASGPALVTAGTNASYTVTLTNNGPDNAQNVVLSDTLPAGATNASITPVSNPDGFSFTLANGVFTSAPVPMANRHRDVFTVSVFVPTSLATGSVFNDTASVTSTTADPNPYDDASTVIGAKGPSISIVANYNAINFGQAATLLGGAGSIPPDSQGAVGPSSYIEVINDAIAIFVPRTSGLNPTTDSLDNLFAVQGKLPDPNPNDPFGNFFTDPAVIFDEQAQRFIVGMAEVDPGPQFLPQSLGNNSSVFDIAVSKSSDPRTLTTADWNFYQINTTEANVFSDYPGNLGYNGGALVFTLNEFETLDFNQIQDHVLVTAVNMSDLTNGVPAASLHVYKTDFHGANLRPTTMHDSTSANDPMWLVQEHLDASGNPDGQHIDVVKMTNVLSSSPTFTTTTLAVTPYAQVVQPLQPDGSGVTPTLDSRIQKAAEQGGTLVAAHAVANTAGNQDLVQWYQIDVTSGTPVLHDQGDIGAGPYTYLYFPGIDINPAGDIGISYIQSGTDNPNDFMSMYVTGRTPSDPAGTIEAPVLAQAGLQVYEDFGPQFGVTQRAGDLSGINVASDGSFWAINEFADDEALPDPNNPGADWGTNVTSFTLPPTSSKNSSATVVMSSVNPSALGQSVTFTATVSAVAPGSGTPTGTVTFLDGATTLGTTTLNSGSATLATSSLAAGNHVITVSYAGDSNFNPSTSAPITQTVNKANSSTTVSSSVNPSLFGQSVTFTATVSSAAGTPSGTVTFLDGAATLGTASLSSGSATFAASSLAVGSHVLTVSYAGDSNFNASTSSAITQTVNKGNSSTTLSSSVNPSVFGQSVTFTATVSAVAPAVGTGTGTVTFLDGAATLGTASLSSGSAILATSSLAAGNHVITVSYAGDSNFNASTSAAIAQTVNKANSSTTVSSSVNPSLFGQSVTFTAMVSSAGGTPSGTVTFLDGAATLGTATLSSGSATFATSLLAVGNHVITVSYAGDSNFNTSTSTAITQTVNGNASTTTTVSSSLNSSVFGQSVTFTATVAPTSGSGTPTGTATFLDGGVSIGSSTLSSGSTTFSTSSLSVAMHTITVSYSGDSNFASSNSAAITQTVNKGNSSTAVTSSVNPSVFGQSVTFTATVSAVSPALGTATGTMTFLDRAATLGTASLSSGSATLATASLAVGNHVITVSYAGDSNFNASTSSAITQSVNKGDSSTAVTSSVNPSVFGQSVTFTATVSAVSPALGTATGTVTFLDGAATLGTASLSSGSATLATSSLAAGNHVITASYGGDSNFNASISSTITQTVNNGNSSTTVSSSVNPSVFGQSVILTATVSAVSPAAGIATGTVTFLDGAATLGTASLSSGNATLAISSLAVGTHVITVSYAGDSNFNASTSSAIMQTVNKGNSSTTAASSVNPSVFGQSVTFTATVSAVSPAAGTATGTVTFLDGAATLGTASLSSGSATFSTSSLAIGNHVINVSYAGDSNFNASTSSAITQTVNKGNSSTTVTSSVNPSVFGQPVTFTATVSVLSPASGTATGTVTFLDSGASIGSKTLSGGSATFSTSSLPVGNHVITVSYAGDSNFNASTSSAITQTVNKGNSSPAVSSSVNPSVFGQSVTFTATVSAVLPAAGTATGTVTFLDGGISIGSKTLSGGSATFSTSSLAVGNHIITASYAGDSNFNASTSAAINQTVNTASTSTNVSSSQNPTVIGQSVTFTATVSAAAPGSGTPTGTVTFLDGATTLGTASLSGGNATLATSSLSVGNHTIAVSYGGDANFNSSASATITQTVNGNTSTTTTVSSSLNPSVFGQSVTFTATITPISGSGTPTGTATFLDGGASIASGTLSSGSATFSTSSLSVAMHTITVSYSGDSNFANSTSSAITQTVNKANSSTAVSSSVDPSVFGQSVTFTATVSPLSPATGTATGTVTFLDSGVSIASKTLSSGSATFSTSSLAVGKHVITVSYAGDINFNASTSSAITQTVNKASTSTAVSSSVNPSVSGQSVTFTATVTASSGDTPSGTVTFNDGGTSIGAQMLNTSGTATLTTKSLAAGTHSITAVYGGSLTLASSTSPVLTQTVNVASTTITLTLVHNPSVYGQNVGISAKVNGGAVIEGTVSFYDGTTLLFTAQPPEVSNTYGFQINSLSVGTHPITAVYNGDSNYLSSTSTALTQTVNEANTTTTLSSSVNPSNFGVSITFTATVSANAPSLGVLLPTGTVVFQDGATTLGSGTLTISGSVASATFSTSALAAGSHPITAIYNGDGNFLASKSGTLLQTVRPASTSTTLASSLNPSNLGQSVTFTATLTSPAGTPSGTVNFLDGTATLGSAALNATGVAAFSTSSLGVGTHSITAVYAGSNNFATSTSSAVSQTVNPAAIATTVTDSIHSSRLGARVTFTAAISPGVAGLLITGTVMFQDGSTPLNKAQGPAFASPTLAPSLLSSNSRTTTTAVSAPTTLMANQPSPSPDALIVDRLFASAIYDADGRIHPIRQRMTLD
jgi:hypothetical protein